jgi:hypothetical protein
MYAILGFMGVLMVSIGLGTVVIGGIGFSRDTDDSTAHRTLMVGLGLLGGGAALLSLLGIKIMK